MHLLHVTHQYWPALGGSERYITDLSEELARRGHQVDVFTTRSRDYHRWRDELPPFERLNGVDIYRFPSLERGPRTWWALSYGLSHYRLHRARRYEPLIWWGNGPLSPLLFLNVLRKSARYDLVHLNLLHYAHTAYAYAAARARGVPIVLTPHVHSEQDDTHGAEYLRAILRGSDLVFAVSSAEKQFLESLGVHNQRIVVNGNGIKPDAFPALDQAACRRQWDLPPEAVVILFLGRKTEYKGLAQLLEAFRTLRIRYPALYWLALGPETDYSQHLFALHADLPGLIRRGTVSEQEKLEALNACDLLALPSIGEAFGIVYLEAWAVGKPVVGARAGATPAIIHEGEDGLLAAPGDTGELTRQLERLITDPAWRHQLGAQGQRKVRTRYTVPRIADIVEGACVRLLRQCCNQRSPGMVQRSGL